MAVERLTSYHLYKMLFTDDYANELLNSILDNVEGVLFKEAFKNALVCFTHFGKMTDDMNQTGQRKVALKPHHQLKGVQIT